MARSASIRVERVAFLAALKAVLKTFEAYKAKEEAADLKHKEALDKWALEILAKAKYDDVEAHSNGVFLRVSEKVRNSRPKKPETERPTSYSHYAIEELRSVIALLEMSSDETVSTYTYANVARFI